MEFWNLYSGIEFAGERYAANNDSTTRHGCSFVRIRRRWDHFVLEGPEIGDFGNSGAQCMNLAMREGARRILLIGFDMTGGHWHGRHGNRLNNPTETNFTRWRNCLNAEAPALRSAGIEVYRESVQSTLVAYPVLSMRDALAQWL